VGYYTGPASGNSSAANQASQVMCGPGSYCSQGLRFDCPSGTYGDVPLLSSAACSGMCAAGHFCNSGATSATQNPCGSEAW
jgi:hypothetical protein